jgi:hypothetical protein
MCCSGFVLGEWGESCEKRCESAKKRKGPSSNQNREPSRVIIIVPFFCFLGKGKQRNLSWAQGPRTIVGYTGSVAVLSPGTKHPVFLLVAMLLAAATLPVRRCSLSSVLLSTSFATLSFSITNLFTILSGPVSFACLANFCASGCSFSLAVSKCRRTGGA